MDLAAFFNLAPPAAADLGAIAVSKAAGYGARAGEVISGNLARGGDGKFAAAGNASAAKPKAPAGKPKPSQRRTAKPKKPPIDRAAVSAAKRQANRAQVQQATAGALSPKAFDALAAFAANKPADPAQMAALAKAGLAEQGADGAYRLSPQGRTVMDAADAGDSRRALDAISKAGSLTSDRAAAGAKRETAAQARIQRQAEIAARRAAAEAKKKQPPEAKPAKGGGGSGSSKPKKPVPPPQAGAAASDKFATLAARLSEGEALSADDTAALVRNGLAKYDKNKALVLTAAGQRAIRPTKQKSFAVFKDFSGRYRWLAVSSTAFRDRDGEIVSVKALEDDVARTYATGDHGPLRFWHVPGFDIGDCDFRVVHGRSLIESGTFRDEAYGAALSREKESQISLGFLHPRAEPDPSKVFNTIGTFERSYTPGGRASNPFTSLIVHIKEAPMLTDEKRAEAERIFGPEIVAQILSTVERTEKAADAAGVAYKAADAAPPELEAKADVMPDEGAELELDALEAEEPAGEFVGDMTPDAFDARIGALLDQRLAPLMEVLNVEAKMGKYVDEMKGMVGTYAAQKDASVAEQAAQVEALKAQIKAQAESSATAQAALKAQLDELLGDQPAQKGYRASQEGPPPDTAALKDAKPVVDLVSFFGIGAGQ